VVIRLLGARQVGRTPIKPAYIVMLKNQDVNLLLVRLLSAGCLHCVLRLRLMRRGQQEYKDRMVAHGPPSLRFALDELLRVAHKSFSRQYVGSEIDFWSKCCVDRDGASSG